MNTILLDVVTAFEGLLIEPRLTPKEVSPLTVSKEAGEVRILAEGALLSLGAQNKLSQESLRKAGGLFAKWLAKNNVSEAALNLNPLCGLGLPPLAAIRAILEGILLGNFVYDEFRSEKQEKTLGLHLLVNGEKSPSLEEVRGVLQQTQISAEAVNLARAWSHLPPNVLNPFTLAERAQALAAETGLKCTVLDDAALREMGAGAIVAVGQGSGTPARLIVLEHAGEGGKPVALVGKALAMDTGGYNLKPSDGIAGMKYDKSGGMVVLATLVAAARLGLKTPLVGVIAAAENMISGEAYRPDDILKALNGKTIEVLNTDAEGRLVLADALTYAEKTFSPRAIIDLATLTGAVVVALGNTRAGLLSTDEDLAQALWQSGERTFERLWRLPLDEEYFDLIKGTDADLKNVGAGRKAGTIVGGMFLKQFVTPQTPWAHLDIAGVMIAETEQAYCPKGGMGFGVRLLLDYLQTLEE